MNQDKVDRFFLNYHTINSYSYREARRKKNFSVFNFRLKWLYDVWFIELFHSIILHIHHVYQSSIPVQFFFPFLSVDFFFLPSVTFLCDILFFQSLLSFHFNGRKIFPTRPPPPPLSACHVVVKFSCT